LDLLEPIRIIVRKRNDDWSGQYHAGRIVTDDLIERIAMVLYRRDSASWRWSTIGQSHDSKRLQQIPWADAPEEARSHYLSSAYDALLAMRDPPASLARRAAEADGRLSERDVTQSINLLVSAALHTERN
jgi:hypothetical protein